jgi:hypothetical protein
LANHKDIQMEQMAAMAIGAKPLLVELRDIIEAENKYWREYEGGQKKWYSFLMVFKGKDLEKRLSALRKSSWYKSEYIKPHWSENDRKESCFKSSDADNVNNILFLYEDRAPEEYVRLDDTFYEILSRYKMSYAILRPKDMSEDKDLAHKLKETAKKDPNASDLLNAYIYYLNNKHRDALNVVEETLAYLETAELKSSALIELKGKKQSDKKEMVSVTNAAQKLLAQTETNFVYACADEIFELNDDLKEQFVDRVNQIAKAYLESRAALEDLWLALMDGLVDISSVPVADNEEKRCREKLTAGIVDLSLDIIQPRYLAVVLDTSKHIGDINDFAIALRSYVEAEPKKLNKDWDFEQMKWYLGDKLKEEPIKTARTLIATHKFCKSTLDPESIRKYVGQGDLSSLAYKDGWKFGLIRAPFDELDPQKLLGEADKTFAYGGGAFAGGRLTQGLEGLIEEYLKKAKACDPSDEKLQCVRKQLSDALVRFAKKLLFLANNRSLISPPKDPGLVTGTLDILSRGLFGERIKGFATDLVGWSEAGTNQYTRILQAVGNSIVVQADALHQEKIHEEESKDHIESEIYAVNHTLHQSPSDVIDRLLEALRASLNARTGEHENAKDKQSAAEEELDRANEDLKKAMEQVKNIKPKNNETFVESVKRQERKAISAYLLLTSEEPGDQTVQYARAWANKAKEAARTNEPKKPKEYAKTLSDQLADQAKHGKRLDVNDLLLSASSYLAEKLNDFSPEDCNDVNEVCDRVVKVVKDDHLRIYQWLQKASEADKAQEKADSLKKSVEDANEAVDMANSEKTKAENAVEAISIAKYDVLRKADEAGSNSSPEFIRELLWLTLRENQSKEPADSVGYKKYQDAIVVLNDQPPPIKPIVFDKSKLPLKPTAKDVRDLWITLLEYEHDLALRNGDEDRAKEIKEAIEAAREKREGMIFIRPAMAYLRTSFPATSLQGNPNLTWDNMLGGHMIRSIPFAPQIGEFLNPDAKRDARITAEIDKQFWQNINRVRVAGGGNTNYAVVKDDIGNWYVKGYSSNPEDIIQSAQNLALFSAGGKMGTPSLVPSALAEKPNHVRRTTGSALESILSKYETDYREKTKQGHKLLCEIMSNSEKNIKKQIKDLWNSNENVKNKQGALETALEWSYTHFLNQFASGIKNNEKDIGKQRKQIIEGIKRLTQFRNDLIWKITNVYKQDGESTNSDTAAKDAAKSIVRNVVNSQIDDLLANRKDAIKTYENALMFLAEATQPQEK